MCVCLCVYAQSFSHVRLYATLWTVTHQAPLSMRFSRQEYGSGLPFPPPGESSRPRDQTHFQTKLACFSCVGRQILYHWAIWEAPKWNIYLIPNIWLNKSIIPLALAFMNLAVSLTKLWESMPLPHSYLRTSSSNLLSPTHTSLDHWPDLQSLTASASQWFYILIPWPPNFFVFTFYSILQPLQDT